MYFVKMRTFFKEKFGNLTQGPHSHILVMGWGGGGRGGVRRIFLDLKFWPKGIFWSLFMKGTCLDFFGLQKNTGIFWGYQLKSTITYTQILLLVWDFLGYAKKVA